MPTPTISYPCCNCKTMLSIPLGVRRVSCLRCHEPQPAHEANAASLTAEDRVREFQAQLAAVSGRLDQLAVDAHWRRSHPAQEFEDRPPTTWKGFAIAIGGFCMLWALQLHNAYENGLLTRWYQYRLIIAVLAFAWYWQYRELCRAAERQRLDEEEYQRRRERLAPPTGP